MTVIPPHGFEPGIYFGMPMDVYQADPALGSSAFKRLRVSASEFHAYWAGNPDRIVEDSEKEYFVFGRAVHAWVLEGEKAFREGFVVMPEPGPNVLKTVDDMKAWLAARDMATTGTKPVLTKRIEGYDQRVTCLDAFEERAKAAGKSIINLKQFKQIALATAYITKNDEIADAFEGGYPEVSIFWQRRGVRLKARIDYLRTYWNPIDRRQEAMNTDLKSFANRRELPIEEQLDLVANENRVQAGHYMDGIRHVPQFIREGEIYGEGMDPDWIEKLGRCRHIITAFVCYKRQGAPYANARFISPGNGLLDLARAQIESGIDRFTQYYNRFGERGPWITLDPPHELSIDDLPRWAL